MFLTEQKLKSRLQELSMYRYREAIPLPSFQAREDSGEEIHPAAPQPDESWHTMELGEHWSGRDRFLWLAAEAEIPESWQGRTLLGRFHFGLTGGGTNSGFESLLYLNGQPYQGVDSNHIEVFLPEDAAGRTHQLTFRLWSGLEGGGQPKVQRHELRTAEICWLDEPADNLYYTGIAALETVEVLEEHSSERADLLRAVDRAFRRIDWSEPGTTTFYDSVHQAEQLLTTMLEEIGKHSSVQLTAVGHTHIDVAWLWRLKHTRQKAIRSFSTVMRLMERFPEYVFLQTQPQLYDYVKQDAPELYEQIKEKIAEGRWEAGGAMWLEADCNLISGESLTRQLLMGTRFYKEEFGVESDYLWLPDVFGYSWALPQILRKSGIHTFMTTKISWNQYNRMPHDTFRWRGIDGSEVLTHFITTTEPWSQPGSWFYTYNGQLVPKTVKGSWEAYRDKEMNRELLVSYGYGDGGGGVNRTMLEMRRRLDRIPGLPHVRTGMAGDYFRRLQQTVAETDSYVHTWDGELYLEYHRGTYTSQAYNKRMNRKLELLYRDAEWISAWQSAHSGEWADYPQQQLNEGWKIILRNQFHDIIPGSSIREVYEDSRIEYEQSWQIGSKIWEQGSQQLTAAADDDSSSKPSYTIWNSSPWMRTELITIPVQSSTPAERWIDAAGQELTAVQQQEQWTIRVENVPALGYTTIMLDHSDPQGSSVPVDFHKPQVQSALADHSDESLLSVSGNGSNPPITTGSEDRSFSADIAASTEQLLMVEAYRATTPFYEMEWNEAGQLTRLYDREAEREVLTPGARANVLQLFEDKPLNFDAWDIDIFYQEKMKEITTLVDTQVIECNLLRAVVQFEWQLGQSTITQQMVLYADNRRIDFVTRADWHERQQLLKVAFPVHIRATEATYDIQYGNVKRPTHWNTSWDSARFESVGHQWADLSDRGYGVSLLNDCKYGYDIKDNIMRLSLIKCPIHPDTEADQGYHEFTYSLLPHQGDWLQGGTVPAAWALNNPLRITEGNMDNGGGSMFTLSGHTAMISAVKKAEDHNHVILRVHDFSGSRQTLTLDSTLPVTGYRECNLMEQPEQEFQHALPIRFVLEPYEIRTLEIQLQPEF
ncbi:alpha-mannosidase [Paenibacillus bovis]|uniref:Alpha-mannosidase n=1 Tax=Paenibacillus bovis TaxID=1616788 RepID=A0A172ZDK8_9BACL|nr:alpha-mannosidase [Paenibacillus bovis]ANF95609.1 alpha-mannosidase [Paenibacillus bovis]